MPNGHDTDVQVPSFDASDNVIETARSQSPLSHASLIWPILLSLLVLLVIGLLTYEPGTFSQVARALNLWLLLCAGLCIVARVAVGGLRLRYVSNGHLTFRSGLRGQLAWDFASNVTPSAVGGAPLAAVYIARDNRISVGEATALMLFSMLLDQLWFAVSAAFIFAASFYVSVYPSALGGVGAGLLSLYFVGLLAWVSLFAYATLVRPELLQWITSQVFKLKWLRRFSERVAGEMALLKDRASVLRSQPARFYVIGLMYASVTWILRYLALLFIVWAVYEAVPKFQFIVRTAAMMLSSLIMPTPGGAGGIEGMYALFLAPLMPKGLVAPTLLTWRIIAYYVFIAIGVLLTTQQVKKVRRIKKEEREAGLAGSVRK